MGKSADIIRKILCKKRIDEQSIPWITYEVSREDVVCFHLSTNPMLAFTSGDRQYFFRECPPKQKREVYINAQIARFFAYINNNDLKKINFVQELPIKISFNQEIINDFYAITLVSYVSAIVVRIFVRISDRSFQLDGGGF